MIFSAPRANHNPTQTATYSEMTREKTVWQLSLTPVFAVIEVEQEMLQYLDMKEWRALYFDIMSLSRLYVPTNWRGYPARCHYALHRAEYRLMNFLIHHLPVDFRRGHVPQWRELRWVR